MKTSLTALLSIVLFSFAYAQEKSSLPYSATVLLTAPSQASQKNSSTEEKKSLFDPTIELGDIVAAIGILMALYIATATIKASNELAAKNIEASNKASAAAIAASVSLNKKATSVASFQEIYKEYTSSDFRTSLVFVRNELQKLYPPDRQTGFYSLGNVDHIRHVTRVSHFFDFVGMLMADDLLDEDLIVVFLGGSADRTWKELYPYIDNMRTKNADPYYQVHFESLAAMAVIIPESERIKKYNLKKHPNLGSA